MLLRGVAVPNVELGKLDSPGIKPTQILYPRLHSRAPESSFVGTEHKNINDRRGRFEVQRSCCSIRVYEAWCTNRFDMFSGIPGMGSHLMCFDRQLTPSVETMGVHLKRLPATVKSLVGLPHLEKPRSNTLVQFTFHSRSMLFRHVRSYQSWQVEYIYQSSLFG